MVEFEGFPVELETLDVVPLIACPISGLTEGYIGLGRWTRLATAAVRDMIPQSGLSAKELSRAMLYLGLPNLEERRLPADVGTTLGGRVGEWLGDEGLGARARVYPLGNAAAVVALQHAIGDLQSGSVELAFVGGVDSLLELDSLDRLLEGRRLKTDDNIDGLVPGEAAAFLLLEKVEHAVARGASILATVEAPATAQEPQTIWGNEPTDGSGLSAAVAATLSQLSDGGRHTGLIICDLNGETYRAKEFANTVPRVLSTIETPWQLWHPADCIGDTGAAGTLVGSCIAAHAFSADNTEADGALAWASSDDGLRGSFYLRRHAVKEEQWA
jgi:3-oxoacyl-[acyl-carrier-protein] synthase-1